TRDSSASPSSESTSTRRARGVLDAFDVDGDQYEPVLLVTLGYPAEEAADVENERKYRRPVDEIVHYDEFDPVESTELPEDAVAEAAADD
ncbi:hypothetical protein GJ632_21300, partial [Halogeometricum sp. CBA1124]|nr:hypothetical protein [Halogeometricum sp. CBA1124]